MEKIKRNELVVLLADVLVSGLRSGDVGTVVEVFEVTDHHPEGYLVEFVNEKGETLAELSVTDLQQLMKLNCKLNAAALNETDKLAAQGWVDHGLFKNNPDVLKLFDDVEQDRDRHLIGGE